MERTPTAFKLLAELATHISEAYLRYVEYREKSLDEIKDDLANSLLGIRKTILVVIDDIDRLTDLLKQLGLFERVEQERLKVLLEGHFPLLFKNLRDVYRFLSTLEFHIGVLQKQTVLEVDCIDLIILEGLRQQEPKIYERISLFKTPLLMRSEHILKKDQEIKREQQNAKDRLAQDASPDNQNHVLELLSDLFPTSLYDKADPQKWQREFRLCDANAFERYFLLAVPSGMIARHEIEELVASAGNRAELGRRLKEYHERGQLIDILSLLEAYVGQIDLSAAKPFLTALFDCSELFETKPGVIFDTNSTVSLKRVAFWFLRREPDASLRVEALLSSIQETNGLNVPLKMVADEHGSRKRQRDNSFLVTEDKLPLLREAAVRKIQKTAEANTLQNHPQLAYILNEWREWAPPIEAGNFALELTSTKEGLLIFLKAYFGLGNPDADLDGDELLIAIINIEKIIPTPELLKRINQYAFYDPSEKRLVSSFLTAIEHRQEFERNQKTPTSPNAPAALS